MKLTDFDPRKQPHGIQTAMAGVMGELLIWCLFSDLGSALTEQAARYRDKAAQRASLRPSAEAECFRTLMQVQALYASGEKDAAQTAETVLTEAVTGLQAPVTPGARLALRMLTGQASLLMPARLGVRQFQYGVRRLPGM